MPHPVAIAEGRVLPGIRPTVLGTLSIELVVVVCAVRVEMACGPGARQPPSSARVILRGAYLAYLDQFPRRGLELLRVVVFGGGAKPPKT